MADREVGLKKSSVKTLVDHFCQIHPENFHHESKQKLAVATHAYLEKLIGESLKVERAKTDNNGLQQISIRPQAVQDAMDRLTVYPITELRAYLNKMCNHLSGLILGGVIGAFITSGTFDRRLFVFALVAGLIFFLPKIVPAKFF